MKSGSLTEAQQVTAKIPKESVTHTASCRPETSTPFKWENCCGNVFHDRSTSEGKIAALVPAMQLGVGFQSGVEALASLYQLIYDKWASGSLNAPLTRIQIDEKNVLL